MQRKGIPGILTLLLLLVLSGCTRNNMKEPVELEFSSHSVDLNKIRVEESQLRFPCEEVIESYNEFTWRFKATDLINDYDKEFFKDSLLVTYCKKEPSRSNEVSISSVAYQNNHLILHVKRVVPPIGNDAMASHRTLVEVSKPNQQLKTIEEKIHDYSFNYGHFNPMEDSSREDITNFIEMEKDRLTDLILSITFKSILSDEEINTINRNLRMDQDYLYHTERHNQSIAEFYIPKAVDLQLEPIYTLLNEKEIDSISISIGYEVEDN